MLQKPSGVFYGWWVVAASLTALSIGAGVYWQGFGVFFLPLAQEFSTSRTAMAGAVSISQMEGGLLGPLGGYLVDKYGPRRVMLAGISVMGIGFLLMSRVQTLVQFYLVFILLISVGMSIGIRVPTMVGATNWFIRRRGTALGLTTSGAGLGGLFVPILGWLIVEVGWRITSVVAGLMVLGVGLPMAMVVRDRPEKYGLRPDGDPQPAAGVVPDTGGEGSGASGARRPWALEPQYTIAQALRTPVFWLLGLAFGLRQLVIGAIGLHLVPSLVGGGIRPEVAATVLGATGVASVLGRLGCGWLADRLEKRYVMAATMGLVAVGAVVLANATAWWHLVVFVVVYAVGWGGGATLMFAVRGEYYGRRAFGTISGTMDLVQMFGLVLGPLFAGLVYDVTGSYYPAFMVFAACGTLAAAIMVFLRPPARVSPTSPRA